MKSINGEVSKTAINIMQEKFDFIGVGFCSNDYLSLLPRIPIDSKVRISKHIIQGGGPAGNSTVAAARLGLKAAFFTAIGDDDAGKRIMRDFESENVCTDYISVRRGCDSPIAYCWIDEPTGRRSVAWTRGNIRELEASDVNLGIVAGAKILHMDGHNPKGALAAAKKAKECGVLVSFDAGTVRDGVAELLPLADILITSEAFAREWTGEEDLETALEKLSKIGAAVTGCTMGENGSMVYDRGRFVKCPAFKVEVVDTTGAGDLFHTGFAVRYLETRDLMECQRFGAACAALKCAAIGGRTAAPTREQVDEFLSKH